MPIYSANRVSGASARIVAAEGYTENDFGRILMECSINDMRLFNAAIARDLQEASALNEGTMVTSELQALREFSAKEAWDGLVEKLKRLWAKIKGVFRNVYAKLSVWLNKNTKLYIAQNRKYLLGKKNLSYCKIPHYRKPKKNGNLKDAINDAIKPIKDKADWFKKIKIAGTLAGLDYENNKNTKVVEYNVDDLIKDNYEEADENLTFGDVGFNLDTLFSNLSANSTYIKELKKANKDIDKCFDEAIKVVKDAAKKLEKSDTKDSYQATSKKIGELQSTATKSVKAIINLVKFALKNDRGLIAALVAFSGEKPDSINDSAYLEMAYAIGFDALREETEDMTDEDIQDAADDLQITISIDGDVDADVNVEDNTDSDDE